MARPGRKRKLRQREHNYNPSFYPGSTVAGLTAPQLQAINLEQSTGLGNLNGPGSVANTSAQQIVDTASGAYLPGGSQFNPFFSDLQQNVLSQVVPGLESQFNQGNSMNNPGTARAVSMGATDALGNIAAQMYEAERNNQLKAAGLAPQTQGLQYQNIGAISDAGAQLQNQQQQQINDAVARWNYQQQLPYQQLNNYAALVGGNYGGTTTVQQPYFTNPTGNALSGAVGGGLLGGMLGPSLGIGSGFGALGGAGIGGLLPFL
ncbi:MAG TPA: hypothetical protein VGB82_23930 [Alphaproteobacteria bacterium]